MRGIAMGAVLAVALGAGPLAAQGLPGSRLGLEPYVGAFVDPYDISPDGQRIGALAGVRLGYDLGSRARLLADVASAGTRNVSNPSGLESYYVYDNEWVLTTVGAEYDVVAGRTRLALGVRAGAGWRRIELEGEVGQPGDTQRYEHDRFDPVELVAPTLTLSHEIASGAALRLTLTDRMFDVTEGPVEHSPGISLGVSLR